MLLQSLVTDPIYFLQFVVIIVLSITLHELGHGVAAIYQGDNTPIESGHMTWNPVVHMGWVSLIALMIIGIAWGQMPVRPHRFKDGSTGRIMVAAAGPMVNFSIAAVCIVILNSFPRQGGLPIDLNFFYLAAYINLGLGIFNLLPSPPLDGFTVFSELIPELKQNNNSQWATLLVVVLYVTGGIGFLWAISASILRMLT